LDIEFVLLKFGKKIRIFLFLKITETKSATTQNEELEKRRKIERILSLQHKDGLESLDKEPPPLNKYKICFNSLSLSLSLFVS
jgi:hypothetical protein